MASSYSTSYSQPCSIYIVQAPNGAVKIGIAKDVRLRMVDLQIGNPEALRLIYQVDVSKRSAAEALETILHKRYAPDILRGEWFAVEAERLIADIEFAIAFAQAVTEVEFRGQVIAPELEPPKPATTSAPVDDAIYLRAIDVVRRLDKASISLLQRRLNIGYSHAARIIERMESEGVIHPYAGGNNQRRIVK